MELEEKAICMKNELEQKEMRMRNQMMASKNELEQKEMRMRNQMMASKNELEQKEIRMRNQMMASKIEISRANKSIQELKKEKLLIKLDSNKIELNLKNSLKKAKSSHQKKKKFTRNINHIMNEPRQTREEEAEPETTTSLYQKFKNAVRRTFF